MAAANRTIRHIIYAPNMLMIAKHLRVMNRGMATMSSTNHFSKTVSNCLWSQDPSLPLPGNTGIDMKALEQEEAKQNPQQQQPPYQSIASAFLSIENEAMRKHNVLTQFINEKIEEGSVEGEVIETRSENDNVECKIQTCPQSLVKGFRGLFENIPGNGKTFTVITISQKTENDMTAWSEDVDVERETLIKSFIDSAKEICTKIKGNGYWADFIEPASGHAYYSEHKNEALFETDDRMNQLGFTIDDLGCCKVILHKEWMSNVFVGLIFTNAPVESHVFEQI